MEPANFHRPYWPSARPRGQTRAKKNPACPRFEPDLVFAFFKSQFRTQKKIIQISISAKSPQTTQFFRAGRRPRESLRFRSHVVTRHIDGSLCTPPPSRRLLPQRRLVPQRRLPPTSTPPLSTTPSPTSTPPPTSSLPAISTPPLLNDASHLHTAGYTPTPPPISQPRLLT